MSHNLFVSFEMSDPTREAPLVLAAIEELGQAVRIFSQLWYVRSRINVGDAACLVWDVMHQSDALLVIDVSNQQVASFNVNETAWREVVTHWRPLFADADERRAGEFERLGAGGGVVAAAESSHGLNATRCEGLPPEKEPAHEFPCMQGQRTGVRYGKTSR